MMNKLDLMKIFIEAAEQKSFSKAGKNLSISPPVVSRSIARLEGNLNTKLFYRTTRNIRLTDAGGAYYEKAKFILKEIENIEESIQNSNIVGNLVISAPRIFGKKFLPPIIREYIETNPDINIKLHLTDDIEDLAKNGIDISIRIGHLNDSNLFAKKVGEVCKVTCATKTYLKKHGYPEKLTDLNEHQIIHTTAIDNTTTWLFETSKHKRSVKIKPKIISNQVDTAINAVKSDIGIGRFMCYQVTDAFDDTTLYRVLGEYETCYLPVHIVHLDGGKAASKVSSFIKLATMRLRENKYLNYIN